MAGSEQTLPDQSCASIVDGREFCLRMQGDPPGVNIIWQGFYETDDPSNPAKHLKKTYRLNTNGGPNQWCGWQLIESPAPGKWFRMSAWIKYIDLVPVPTYGHSFKIQGQDDYDWISGMSPNEWMWVSSVNPVVVDGDSNLFIYIFDSVDRYTQV